MRANARTSSTDTIWYIIASVKVRIGVAIGALPLERFGTVLDDLDDLGFDSVWLPETFQRGGVDPLVGLAFAAARVPRLKLGTHLVAPGRNPYVLARELAQLDRLSGGRLLLTFVAGLDEPAERIAQGLPSGDRTGWFDEHLGRHPRLVGRQRGATASRSTAARRRIRWRSGSAAGRTERSCAPGA